MLAMAHRFTGFLAFVTILVFWVATIASEISGDIQTITAVKQAVPWGLLVLVPALMATGASGFNLGKRISAPLIRAKSRRMPIIAANGILILIPCALALSHFATEGNFGTAFILVQALELVAGAVNLSLMSLNIRDGLVFKGRIRRKKS